MWHNIQLRIWRRQQPAAYDGKIWQYGYARWHQVARNLVPAGIAILPNFSIVGRWLLSPPDSELDVVPHALSKASSNTVMRCFMAQVSFELSAQLGHATHVGAQRFGYANAAVGLLVVFKHCHQGAAHGQA